MTRDFVLATSHGALRGQLDMPPAPRGLAVLVRLHDTAEDGPLAAALTAAGHSVLSMPLLSEQEMHFPDAAYNVPLLTQRIADLLDAIRNDGDTEGQPVMLLAGGHAAPAAIRAAALRDAQVEALACRSGLIDLAGIQNLRLLAAPLLMLADTDDGLSAASYQRAAQYLSVPHRLLRLQPGESPDSHVARWFREHLQAI